MPRQHDSSPLPAVRQLRRLKMQNKVTAIAVLICLTILASVWLERDRLCDFRVKTKLIEVDAGLSYELNR